MIKRKLKRYQLTFDFNTEKLEIYAKSKTQPYKELHDYLTGKWNFEHNKDSDYTSPFIKRRAIYKIIREIPKEFLYFKECKKKFKITTIDEKLYNADEIMDDQIAEDKNLSKKIKMFEEQKEQEWKNKHGHEPKK